MKTVVYLVLFFTFFCRSLVAQDCLPDGITFTSQADIDSFPINYPGCDTIKGNLVLSENTFYNFQPLNGIEVIEGGLYVIDSGFENFEGLENLTTVGGELFLYYTHPQSLSGLENLTSLGGLYIYESYFIPNFQPLTNLEELNGRISLYLLEELDDISGIAHLSPKGEININSCLNLATLPEMPNLDIDSIDNLVLINSGFYFCNTQWVCEYVESGKPVTIVNNNDKCDDLGWVELTCNYTDNDEDCVYSDIDCDDENPNVSPYEEENPYNGIDDDCNENTPDDDLDGDGFLLADDCNDQNPTINPNAEDIPNNGIDEDCDGEDSIVSNREITSSGISVFPNPVRHQLTIRFSHPLGARVALKSISGQTIMEQEFYQEVLVDMEHLPSGVYVILIEASAYQWVERVVKL